MPTLTDDSYITRKLIKIKNKVSQLQKDYKLLLQYAKDETTGPGDDFNLKIIKNYEIEFANLSAEFHSLSEELKNQLIQPNNIQLLNVEEEKQDPEDTNVKSIELSEKRSGIHYFLQYKMTFYL